MKKNCHNCKHLKHYAAEADDYNSSGFYCEGREYKETGSTEAKHLDQLEGETYRLAPKKCCELRTENTEATQSANNQDHE